jgi:hypothetical protein
MRVLTVASASALVCLLTAGGCFYIPTDEDRVNMGLHEIETLHWAQSQSLLLRAQQQAWKKQLSGDPRVSDCRIAIRPDSQPTPVGGRPTVKFSAYVVFDPDAEDLQAIDKTQQQFVDLAQADPNAHPSLGDTPEERAESARKYGREQQLSVILSDLLRSSAERAGLEVSFVLEGVEHDGRFLMEGELKHPLAESRHEAWDLNPKPVQP